MEQRINANDKCSNARGSINQVSSNNPIFSASTDMIKPTDTNVNCLTTLTKEDKDCWFDRWTIPTRQEKIEEPNVNMTRTSFCI